MRRARDSSSPRRYAILGGALALGASALGGAGCDYVDTPYTRVVLANGYPASATLPLTIYVAQWQAVAFADPVPPGASSDAKDANPCSPNTAWAVLAPGWDPASSQGPGSFVVLESRSGFGAELGDTLTIPVDDAHFAGNCAAGSTLTQAQADFITQTVFASVFAGLRYDAATCTTTSGGDAGSP
jgi:hypothetical protein